MPKDVICSPIIIPSKISKKMSSNRSSFSQIFLKLTSRLSNGSHASKKGSSEVETEAPQEECSQKGSSEKAAMIGTKLEKGPSSRSANSVKGVMASILPSRTLPTIQSEKGNRLGSTLVRSSTKHLQMAIPTEKVFSHTVISSLQRLIRGATGDSEEDENERLDHPLQRYLGRQAPKVPSSFWERVIGVTRCENDSLKKVGIRQTSDGRIRDIVQNFWNGDETDKGTGSILGDTRVAWSHCDIFDIDVPPDELEESYVVRAFSAFAQRCADFLTFVAALSIWYAMLLAAFEPVLQHDPQVGYDTVIYEALGIFDIVLNAMYLLGSLTRLRTTVINEVAGTEMADASYIMRETLRSKTFWVDVVTCIPCAIPGVPVWLGCSKLLRGWRLVGRGDPWLKQNNLHFMARCVFMILLGGHVLGCLWFRAVLRHVQSHPMILASALGGRASFETANRPLLLYYAYAWKIGVYLLLGIDTVGSTVSENFLVAVCAPIGALANAMVFSQIIVMVSRRAALDTEQAEHNNAVRQAMESLDLPRSLRLRILAFYSYQQIHRSSLTLEALFDGLSSQLSFELHLVLYYGILTKVPLFRKTDPPVLRQIVCVLEDKLFLPGDYICRQGDAGLEMYFIYSGSCSVLSENLSDVMSILRAGDSFGEVSLLTGQRRTAYVRSDKFGVMATLPKSHFDSIMRNSPKQLEVIISQLRDSQKMAIQSFARGDANPPSSRQGSRRPSDELETGQEDPQIPSRRASTTSLGSRVHSRRGSNVDNAPLTSSSRNHRTSLARNKLGARRQSCLKGSSKDEPAPVTKESSMLPDGAVSESRMADEEEERGNYLSMSKSLSAQPRLPSSSVLKLPDQTGRPGMPSPRPVVSPLPKRRVSILTGNTEIGPGGGARPRGLTFLENPSVVPVFKASGSDVGGQKVESVKEEDEREEESEAQENADEFGTEGLKKEQQEIKTTAGTSKSTVSFGKRHSFPDEMVGPSVLKTKSTGDSGSSSMPSSFRVKPGPVPSSLTFTRPRDPNDKAWSDFRSRVMALRTQILEVSGKQSEVAQWLDAQSSELLEMKSVARSVSEEINAMTPEIGDLELDESDLDSDEEAEEKPKPRTKLYIEPLRALRFLSEDAHDLLNDISDAVEMRLDAQPPGSDVFAKAIEMCHTTSKQRASRRSFMEDDDNDAAEGKRTRIRFSELHREQTVL